MADTKISALPASTTPLAGTEVLPVVQSGATKQVSVANLTAGRNVDMLQGNATNAFQVTKAGSDTPWVGPHFTLDNGGAGAAERVWAWQLSAADQLDLLQYDGTNWNRWFRFTSAGNFAPMVSGKGIDFSATPGTGTSELFSDYEEGTWTPTFTTTGTGFTAISYTTQSGVYTKVGNTVTVYFSIVIASVTVGAASGAMVVSGMPFTASNGTGNTGFQTNFVTVGPDFMQFYGAGTNALLRYKVGGSWANVAPANAQGGLQLDGSITYFV